MSVTTLKPYRENKLMGFARRAVEPLRRRYSDETLQYYAIVSATAGALVLVMPAGLVTSWLVLAACWLLGAVLIGASVLVHIGMLAAAQLRQHRNNERILNSLVEVPSPAEQLIRGYYAHEEQKKRGEV